MRPPGIEPGSRGWEPSILTTILRAQIFINVPLMKFYHKNIYNEILIIFFILFLILKMVSAIV